MFLSETHFISLSMLFNMSLNLIVEANERFKQLSGTALQGANKSTVCTKEVLPGVETESSCDYGDQNIQTTE